MPYTKCNLLFEAKASLTVYVNISSHCTILMTDMQSLYDNMLSKYTVEVLKLFIFSNVAVPRLKQKDYQENCFTRSKVFYVTEIKIHHFLLDSCEHTVCFPGLLSQRTINWVNKYNK